VLGLAYEHEQSRAGAHRPDRVTADKVRQMIYFDGRKVPLLIGLLRQYEARRTMVS
jgi:hypothetical protein